MSEFVRLNEVAQVRRGASPRPIDDPRYFGGRVGWVRISDVTRARRHLRSTEQYLSRLGESLSVRVRPGDLIMSICGSIGRPVILDMDACIHDGFVQFTDLKRIDTTFLFYVLQFSEQAFNAMGQSGTQTNLNTTLVGRHKFYCPSLSTQKRIAAILTSLDTCIEATEALIEKHLQIKAGLMLNLFTRGVTADGLLRPAPAEARGLYQATKLGLLPTDWQVAKLGDLVNPSRPIVYGILMPGYGFPGGVPVVKVKDIRDRRIAFEDLLLTSPQIDNEYRRSRLKAGDVLFTIRGTVGRVAVIPEVLEGANITQDTARMDLTGVSGEFASYYFETPMAKRFFDVNTLGVAVQGINLGELRKLLVPVPPPPEQERIVAMVAAAYRRIDSENAVLEKLRMQKQGLMQDLLTGKVPVRAD